jgi:hypothetical protein
MEKQRTTGPCTSIGNGQACATTSFPAFLTAPPDLPSRLITLSKSSMASIASFGREGSKSLCTLSRAFSLLSAGTRFLQRTSYAKTSVVVLPRCAAFAASLSLCLAVGASTILEPFAFLIGVLSMASAGSLVTSWMKSGREHPVTCIVASASPTAYGDSGRRGKSSSHQSTGGAGVVGSRGGPPTITWTTSRSMG